MKNILLAAIYIGLEGLIIILAIEKDITWSTFAFLTFFIVCLALGLIINIITAPERKLEKKNDIILVVMKKKAIMKDWSKIKQNQLN